jgi:predicted ATPase
MGVLSLAARLNQRFQFVMRANRGALPRHQTLQAAIDWSYQLLSVSERIVLQRLGIFAGSFAPEAAEYVCEGGASDHNDQLVMTPETVFNHLLQLVNKSLVQHNQQTERYRLLETIRVFCLERLREAGETQTISTAHLLWYLQFAEDVAPRLSGPEQARWGARLEAEHDNLRAALIWALDTLQVEQAARLALALWRWWHAHTYQREGLDWLQRILALETTQPLPPKLRPHLFNALGVLATSMYQFDRATAYHDEALRLWRAEGNQAGIAQALHDISVQQFEEMHQDRALAYANESLALARTLGDQAAVARALSA